MKILVTYPLCPQLVESGLGDLVVYRPELAVQTEDAMRRALAEHLPRAVLVNGRCPDTKTLTTWQEEAQRPVQLIRCHGEGKGARIDLDGVGLEQFCGTPSHQPDDLQALGLAERHLMHHNSAQRLAACGISTQASASLVGSRVTLVGAGIVNLMTACKLAEAGADVEVLDARPDPRSGVDWRHLGTTHGGDNARMFSFTEADNYNAKGHLPDSNRRTVLRQTITEGGWLAVRSEAFDRQESAWIERFHALPRWQAEVFTEDIHGFTIASYPLWKRLRRDIAHLFDGVGYTSGILQLYAQAQKADAAEALHARLGSLVKGLNRDELIRRHPACRDGVEDGQIARGLEVRGFTLGIHDFVARLLQHLEARGVHFRWRQPVTAVMRSDDGEVTGLQTQNGVVRSEHYVLSPGVYGGRLLEGTRTAGKIQGVLGLWMSFPNLEPRQRQSIKLHRGGQVGEDSNINLGTDAAGRSILILGSGYGYLGSHALDMDSPEIGCLFEALEQTAQRYFPRAHAAAVRDGTILSSRKACVRPFTSTGLGVFDVSGTADGGRMIVASGHNTGGFAQAPAVAQAVTTTLEGGVHPMQALYDPERGIVPDALMD